MKKFQQSQLGTVQEQQSDKLWDKKKQISATEINYF